MPYIFSFLNESSYMLYKNGEDFILKVLCPKSLGYLLIANTNDKKNAKWARSD